MSPATPPGRLLPEHERLIFDVSAIAPEIAKERGYWSATTQAAMARAGFAQSQRLPPALMIPLHNAAGRQAGYMARPDHPRSDSKGRSLKYEKPSRSANLIDVPPSCREHLGDPSKPLFITEAPRKADALASVGLV